MRIVVVGLGVQGRKRRRFAGVDYVASVDPVGDDADYKSLHDVPIDRYDAVLACIPDEPKLDLVRYCIDNKKHVLIEKPLWTPRDEDISELERAARSRGIVVYTAYNHRFEPHFVRMRDLIVSGELGTIYSCRMFYGNGTARLVREFGLARPRRRRDSGLGIASARHMSVLVRRRRHRCPSYQRKPIRKPRARPRHLCRGRPAAAHRA